MPAGAEVEISSPHNPLVQQIRRLAAPDRKERAARRLCVVEGLKLVSEAVAAELAIETLCYVPGGEPPPAARRTVSVSRRVMEAMSSTKTPQGILALVRIPEPRPVPAGAWTVALDGVQDPANVGTILRTALAFGAGAVALGPGCADPWSPKTLRASAGAVFHLPPQQVAELGVWLHDRPGPVWALVPRGGESLPQADLAGPITLVVGSEAHGISESVRAVARPLSIPMSGAVESLNAAIAVAIAAYEVVSRGR